MGEATTVYSDKRETYSGIKNTYLTKLNINLKARNEDDEYLQIDYEIEKPRSISKPLKIKKDKSSIGDDVLKFMLKRSTSDEVAACSPPDN
ncbi:hypothetical protein EIN_056560 [Entamoeba invadens IP1]|uniref:hypothetical protein n=1 Tax=Entamoeba invadens IP1 TaxID=370355 RepID=UPI0002C3ECFA|nr:hypothetical protein EIN_056560 [Entamoeba invadens IP1]ELP93281.1 hypothetical protein EIN_056560 [Entamoeba invadens IP1]|eukprot:XP_004260052.1 hypothetical protein EIN_056560 [Entamoeba invadens IP1]